MQPRPRTPSESARAVRRMPDVSIGARNAVMPWPRSPGRVRAGGVHDVGGILARLVDSRRPLRDDLAGELLDGGLEGLLGVCELENHKEEWNAEPAELAEIISVLRALRALRSEFVLR